MKPLIIGIAGGSGSGKSTLAHQLALALEGTTASLLEMDSYYRDFTNCTREERDLINWDHPDSFDIGLLSEHLDLLIAGSDVEMPVYDFSTHARAPQTIPVPASEIIVLDGILLLVDERIRSRCDFTIFVDTDADLRLIRRIRRDMRERGRSLDSVLEQYMATVRPMHCEYVEPSRQFADMVLKSRPNEPSNIGGILDVIRTMSRQRQSLVDHRAQARRA